MNKRIKNIIIYVICAVVSMIVFSVCMSNAFIVTYIADKSWNYLNLEANNSYIQKVTFTNEGNLVSFKIPFSIDKGNVLGNESIISIQLINDEKLIEEWDESVENLINEDFQFELSKEIAINKDAPYYVKIVNGSGANCSVGILDDSNEDSIVLNDTEELNSSLCVNYSLKNVNIYKMYYPLFFVIMLLLFIVAFIVFDMGNCGVKNIVVFNVILVTLFNIFSYSIFKNIKNNIYLFEKVTFGIGALIAFAIILLSIVGLFALVHFLNKNEDFDKIFIGMAIPLVLIYFIIFPPWSQPDTYEHYLASYRFSNFVMGYEHEYEWYGRTSDVNFYESNWSKNSNPSMESFYRIQYSLLKDKSEKELIKYPRYLDGIDFYSIISYLPFVIGITISRILNFNPIITIYVARLIALLTYIILMYRAIKRTPIGKGLITVIALFPMCLMMSSAISYDLMVIISTINLIVSIFCYRENRNKINFIELLFWIFVVCAVKGGGYIILLPLLYLIYDKANVSKSTKDIVSCIGMSVLSLTLFNVLLNGNISLFQFGEKGNGNFDISFILNNMGKYINMLFETYIVNMDEIIINIAGNKLALLEDTVPSVIVMTMMVLSFIISYTEKDKLTLKGVNKYCFIIPVVIGLVLTPAMLLSWTPVGSTYIGGLQGRYYLPLFPLFVIVTTKYNERKNNPESIKKKLLIINYVLSFAVVFYLMKLYLCR